MIKERIEDMEVAAIADAIQTHPNENVYQTAEQVRSGSAAQPTVAMLKRFAPDAGDEILDYIDDHARRLKATADSYARTAKTGTSQTDHKAGLITAHPQPGYYSILSPAAPAGPQAGRSAGADLSYTTPAGEIPDTGSQTTMAREPAVSIQI